MKYAILVFAFLSVCFGQIDRVSLQSGDYTVALSDSNALIAFSDTKTPTVRMTLPFETTSSRTNFSTGTVIYGAALTDSTVLIEGRPGVTIINANNAFRSKSYGSEWELKRIGRNLWVLSGDLYSLFLTAFVGDDVLVKAIVDPKATGPFTYKWYKNNNIIPNATNATLKLTNVQFSDSANYRADVSNRTGLVKSETTNLIVR